MDEENRRKGPNGWGVLDPMAELQVFEEDKKLMHPLFLTLYSLGFLARCTPIHYIGHNPDHGRCADHQENGPDN
jgi:hypothetical protein